jgi:hypothetical protein
MTRSIQAKIGAVSFTLIVWAMFLPTQSSAQACYPFHWCVEGEIIGDYLGLGPSPWGVKAAPTYWHNDCRYCELPQCHYSCEGTPLAGELEDEAELAEYAALLRAFMDRDLDEIRAHAASRSNYLRWNPERGAIQLLTCDQTTFAASLNLRDASEVEFAILTESVFGREAAVRE